MICFSKLIPSKYNRQSKSSSISFEPVTHKWSMINVQLWLSNRMNKQVFNHHTFLVNSFITNDQVVERQKVIIKSCQMILHENQLYIQVWSFISQATTKLMSTKPCGLCHKLTFSLSFGPFEKWMCKPVNKSRNYTLVCFHTHSEPSMTPTAGVVYTLY